jgi:hypothetical protein
MKNVIWIDYKYIQKYRKNYKSINNPKNLSLKKSDVSTVNNDEKIKNDEVYNNMIKIEEIIGDELGVGGLEGGGLGTKEKGVKNKSIKREFESINNDDIKDDVVIDNKVNVQVDDAKARYLARKKMK